MNRVLPVECRDGRQCDDLADVTSLADGRTPYGALRSWVARFADFLVTKHGLAEAMHSDQAGFESLHAEFVDRLLPVLDRLLTESAAAGETHGDVRAYDLMLGIGNLCIGVLLAGLARESPRPEGSAEQRA